MISLKELKFVDTWAKKAPYPGDDYAKETFENIEIMFDKYNKQMKDKKYSIIFSDSEEYEFEIFDFNICHMLGIDLKSLTDPLYHNVIKEVLNIDLDKGKISSYQLVKCLIKKYKEVLKYDASEELRIINYYKSRIKCAIFEQLSEFEQFNFGKINTTDTSKLLYTPSNEPVCPYFLIRLSKEENEQIYGVSSLLAPEREKLSPYFSQKAAIPTQIIVDNNHDLHKFNATPKEKIDLLNMYKLIISECGVESNIDISGDYLSALSSILENQKKEKILKK